MNSPTTAAPQKERAEYIPLILSDMLPFPKQANLKGPFLACGPPCNLLLGTKKCAQVAIVCWCFSPGGWGPAVASPAAARLSGSGPVVSEAGTGI